MDYDGKIAKNLIRLPYELRRKLKLIATYENISMNEKALSYIRNGLKGEEIITEELISSIEKLII